MKSKLNLLIALSSVSMFGFYCVNAAQAQNQRQAPPQRIQEDGGGTFMEEEQTQPVNGRGQSRPKVNVIKESAASRQQVTDNTGNGFMEEVTESKPRNAARVPIDLRNTNVQVDPKGHIVPMINRAAGPVQYQYNSGLQAYQEMPVPTFAPSYGVNPFGMPYGSYGASYVPVAPGTIPGIRSMNIPPGYFYGNNYGYLPYTQTQYSGTYSQTSLTGDSAGMIMPMFRNPGR